MVLWAAGFGARAAPGGWMAAVVFAYFVLTPLIYARWSYLRRHVETEKTFAALAGAGHGPWVYDASPSSSSRTEPTTAGR